ncbi:hypothetical protein STEG23_033749 [Scotinomys teguina]
MEVVAAAPRCQLLLIMLMAAMLLPGMKGSPLLVQRTVTRTFELQESIGKDLIVKCFCEMLARIFHTFKITDAAKTSYLHYSTHIAEEAFIWEEKTRLALYSQRSVWLCLMSVGIKGMCHNCLAKIYLFMYVGVLSGSNRIKPHQTGTNRIKLLQAASNRIKLVQIRSNQFKLYQTGSNHIKLVQTSSKDQTGSNRIKLVQTRLNRIIPDQTGFA